MAFAISNPKDFWTGVIYVGIGLAAVVIGREYDMGSATRMGPAYFPTVLGVILCAIGLASAVRSFIRRGQPIGAFAFKTLLLVLVATLLFGALVRGGGLIVALPVLVIVSAYASSRFRLGPTVLLAIGLTAFSAVVFIKGLGVPLPVIGPWFGS